MDFGFPEAAEEFRAEVRAFIAEQLTHEVIAATRDGTIHAPAMHKAMAERGWLRGAVPAELGGGGRDPLELAVLVEELQLAGAPYDAMAVTIIVAAVLLDHGSDFCKSEVAPRMLDGDSLGCFGYSEPESGSDVAAAKTRAVRDGDEWVVDGSKMWTTLAHVSDYVLLLTRTDFDVAKHRGLTFFAVPLDLPGIEIQPVRTMGTERSNATFYDGVRLHDRYRVGEVNGGWEVMKTALKYERGVTGGQFPSPPLIDSALSWLRSAAAPDGSALLDDPSVRETLIRAMIDVEVCRSFAYHTAWLASEGVMFGVEGSMTKLFASESYKRHCTELQDLMGAEGMLTHHNADAPLGGLVEEHVRHSPVTTIYGGTSEISRNLIAETRLGLPRSR